RTHKKPGAAPMVCSRADANRSPDGGPSTCPGQERDEKARPVYARCNRLQEGQGEIVLPWLRIIADISDESRDHAGAAWALVQFPPRDDGTDARSRARLRRLRDSSGRSSCTGAAGHPRNPEPTPTVPRPGEPGVRSAAGEE